jgi:hypothetical protein
MERPSRLRSQIKDGYLRKTGFSDLRVGCRVPRGGPKSQREFSVGANWQCRRACVFGLAGARPGRVVPDVCRDDNQERCDQPTAARSPASPSGASPGKARASRTNPPLRLVGPTVFVAVLVVVLGGCGSTQPKRQASVQDASFVARSCRSDKPAGGLVKLLLRNRTPIPRL